MSLRNHSIKFLLFLLVFFNANNFAQGFQRELNSIPFSDDEGDLKNIFSGGTNNIEHQFIDIDGDYDYDIIYLDSDGTYGIYTNAGSSFDPSFQLSFDTIPGLKLLDWFYFVDIDSDDDIDLFTAGPGSIIEFRKNIGNKNNPDFVLEIDTVKDNNGDIIFSEFNSNPIFADIDADGDYDFITGNSVGTLTFYENIGTAEEFNLKFITNFWQEIFIVGGALTSENPFLHGASSLDFADIDNDGDFDLYWGDFFGRSIYYLRNNGTAEIPDINLTFSAYPQNADSVYTSGFNMPRFVDIDNDNDLDMFVSVLYDPTVPQSLMFYENKGDQTNPDLIKITENYLKTLDAGTQSVPCFADIDNDSDMDLFIGSSKNPNGSLYFFENTGSVNNPKLQLRDSSYFNINGELSIAPAFGDIDGDNDLDLFIGNFNGTFSYYENIGNKNSPSFQFNQIIKNSDGTNIDIGVFARPLLIDIDSDGDLDMITGRFNGRLSFYKNIGTKFLYSFEEDTSFFSTLDVGDLSSAILFDYDADNILDLFIGSRTGNIFYYSNNGTNQAPQWQLITDQFLAQNFGADASLNFIDIDNDTDPDIFIGNTKGGLYFYRNQTVTSIKENSVNIIEDFAQIDAYPNPFNPSINFKVQIKNPGNYSIIIYNMLGEKVKEFWKGFLDSENDFIWNAKNNSGNAVSSGTYIFTVSNNEKMISKKIIYLK